MTRYREEPGQYEMDSDQDEDAAPCAECGVWQAEPFLEPCPRGVQPPLGAVCGECAESLRAEVGRMAAE